MAYHSFDTQYPHTAVYNILGLLHLKLCYCVLPMEKATVLSSVQLNVHHVAENITKPK